MQKILVLKSSILGTHSQTNQLSDYVVSKFPNAQITIRDLGTNPLPHFDAIAANALRGEPKTEQDKALLALSDELVAELKNADILIINAPMYNFNIPTQLKSYIDFIARPRVTFQYTENGPEGLIKGKKAIVLASFGGVHQGQTTDIVTPYLKTFLGFIGIDDVDFVYVEGVGSGSEVAAKSQEQARAKIDTLV
ncbi:FMN-dependent NADH-azoreductase [Avibacterium paragallinarum]|uniref:FMN dependent NADH:quinone oxidoreductase n=1 Tax=Avibacterium paragallinarum TaxID=728 RepID=A0AAE5TLZ6_AVIPA|nr:FMN-dependent NADH-azoreductase [Avibacterium paragallinarum]MEE3608992.1 FMN-dependent NADH-azoreductase [Avibacterium paragallinarum]MEE3621985.1 FMN-dependent NADH-azoreductase [Avibacterium paragallinarum]MEE3669820.1 FMN-dependent NADH-azoreductase [Avibacterium paragallinarum]MEE3681830.1 FMN-dependent NADH-azoreductase [Avibacterium paragallinarum]MEE4386168.1 FMN-dependent NADH-azoreductase [Avibacterium paragallinarum]